MQRESPKLVNDFTDRFPLLSFVLLQSLCFLYCVTMCIVRSFIVRAVKKTVLLFNYFSVCMDAQEGFQWTKIKMVNKYFLLKKKYIYFS